MGEREIREKYGGKLDKAINRAIRAELPEGNAALDTLTRLAGPAMQSGWKDRRGHPTEEAVAYFKHKREVVDKLTAAIRAKWGIPPEQSQPAKRPARPRAGKPRAATSGAATPRRRRRSGDPADRTPHSFYQRGSKKTAGKKTR